MYKETFEKVKTFFGEKGITATSATYLANLAQEYASQLHTELQNLSFLDVTVQLIGAGGEPLLLEKGNTEGELNAVESKLETIAKLNSFNAWMREAVKNKEALTNELRDADLQYWAYEHGIDLPKCPTSPSQKSEEQIIATWNVKERNTYLALEAQAATLGKYIHEKGYFNKIRAEYHTKCAKPRVKEGNGHDLTVTLRQPSVPKDAVDKVFMSLQAKHRSINQRLNFLKAKIKEEIHQDFLNRKAKYTEEYDEYRAKRAELVTQYELWLSEENQKLQALKIVVPEAQQETFDFLNSLGAKS